MNSVFSDVERSCAGYRIITSRFYGHFHSHKIASVNSCSAEECYLARLLRPGLYMPSHRDPTKFAYACARTNQFLCLNFSSKLKEGRSLLADQSGSGLA